MDVHCLWQADLSLRTPVAEPRKAAERVLRETIAFHRATGESSGGGPN